VPLIRIRIFNSHLLFAAIKSVGIADAVPTSRKPRRASQVDEGEGEKEMKQSAMLLPAVLLLTACTSVNYRSPDLIERGRDHTTIAVLPFEMVFTGRAPQGMTGEEIIALEEHESVLFQNALYYRLLNRSSAHRKHPIRVEIQPLELTNQMLAGHRIGLRESWAMHPSVLAEMLQVDAVVRATVTKTRYLSDSASFGVTVAAGVLYEVSDGLLPLLLPPFALKTYDIYADAVLIDGTDGHLLWEVAVHRETDWTRPANDVIAGITRGLARRFPYRG